jgi:hypothetical protein
MQQLWQLRSNVRHSAPGAIASGENPHWTQEYEITFAQQIFGNVTEKHTFGSIVWSDDKKHTVTSPIAITSHGR